MDLVDGPRPSTPPEGETTKPESFMRRFWKAFVLAGACAVALFLTVRHRGQDLRLEASAILRAATRASNTPYDLADLKIVNRVLYFVSQNYFDKGRVDPRRMLVGALDFLQKDVPEILIDRFPEHEPKQVRVTVNGKQQTFSIERVDAPWNLSSSLKEIFRFIQPRLQPVEPKDEARRLVEIEMAAANGLLYTLDPHSVLLDVESFKDMRMTTQGKFGGLGIVIEMDKKGRITVKKPMLDTPAIRAGIRARDHIGRINNESTVNMTLQEAVDRLRGEVGAPVDVYIDRDGVSGTKKFTIVRDSIRPPAIDPPARVLSLAASPDKPGGKIGYFRISSFSANTERDLMEALGMFEREKVKGLIMDLRSNPGGLYDQAQKVADAFIESGVLVSMVGVGGMQRKDETATRNGDVKLPLAVLVNQYSASASEIVAGAVKNLDRGVVIGETTFGKGSVQMLFDIDSPVSFSGKAREDKLGLKLTTAQYLTPGDLSIQGVGVTPDVELVPLQVRKRQDEAWIKLQSSTRRRQEADYEWHLENPSARKGVKPSELLSYLYVPPPNSLKAAQEEDEERAEEVEDEAPTEVEESRTDFLMDFARDLLLQAKTSRRRELVTQSKAFFDKVRLDEDKKVAAALEKLGVDWSIGPASTGVAQLAATLVPTTGDGRYTAGQTVKLRGTVKNQGAIPAYRVRAVLKSDNAMFDENEMVFGKIGPGETKTYDLSVKLQKNTLTRTDVIRANLTAVGPIKATTPELTLNIAGLARPLFAYAYQTIDDVAGNLDGQVQRGERVRLLIKVKNIGAGPSIKTEAILRNGQGQEGILISAGRFNAKDLAAGATATFSFVYEVGTDYRGDDYTLELSVADTVFGESVSDKIKIKIAPAGKVPETAVGSLAVTRPDAILREAAAETSLVLGHAAKGATFKLTGRQGAFFRVELESGRPAFIAGADVAPATPGSPGTFDTTWQVMPPVLTVSAPTVASGNAVHVSGVASDDQQVKDLFIRVYNRDSKLPPKKVFYLPNRGDKTRLPFSADVPLWPGSNLVQVFARETNEVQSVQTLVILQPSGPSVAHKSNGDPTSVMPQLPGPATPAKAKVGDKVRP